MSCRKCQKEIPAMAAFCPWCGSKQASRVTRRTRANGAGSAYKRGKSWTAVYVYSWSTNEKLTLGGFATKKEALEYIPVLKAAAPIQPDSHRRELLTRCKAAGAVPAALRLVETFGKALPEATLTFKQVYDLWQPWYEPRIGASTQQGYAAAILHYKDIWHATFAELSTEDLQQCVDECERGRRTKENMKCLAVLMYKFAASRKIAEHNYAQYVYCGKGDMKTRPSFTPDQVELIRRAMGKIPYAEYVYCMIYTGFRPNEMLSLPKEAYHGEYLVGGFKTDAGTDRIIPISPKIMPIIEKLIQTPGPYIFPRDNGLLMTDDYFRAKVFYPLLDSLNIQRVSNEPVIKPYSCRHTFADLMKNVTGSDTDKAALMGHADASMTKYYQSADYTSLKQITDRI